MPFSSLASTASSSNARRVPRASWSNASKAWDDFRDSFDKINDVEAVSGNDVAFASSGPDESYGRDWYLNVGLSKNGNRFYTKLVWNDTYGYYRLPDEYINKGYTITDVRFVITQKRLPSSGTYLFNYNLVQGSVVNKYARSVVQFDLVQKNALNLYTQTSSSSFSQSGSNISGEFNVKIPSRCVSLSVILFLKDPDNAAVNFSDVSFSFGQVPKSGAETADSGIVSDSNQDTANNTATIAENSNRQVEQGDSIIELIKNTIQTISSQLTAFWNQLAGEFTNLYNKMNQQHAEKLQSDQDTRDTITEESEKSRNFIVDGIINGLKSLFIPSDDYFKAWFDDMYAFFNDRFGFLMFPVDLLVQMVNLYLNADSSFAGVPFPEFKWIDGTVVIPAQNVQFTFLETDWGQGIQQKLYFVGNIIMIGALLSLMHRKFEEVLRN